MNPFIYVAGPYSGDAQGNTDRAIDVGNRLINVGFNVYVPHLSHYMHARQQRHYEDWMRIDFDWITRCDALYRMPGDSSGGDREVEFAKKMHIPVFYSVEALFERFRSFIGTL